MKTYVGVDPGKDGAVAIVEQGTRLFFYDAENLDLAALAEVFVTYMGMDGVFVLLEKVQVMPGSRERRLAAGIAAGRPGEEVEVGGGAVGMLKYGIGYGEYRGMLKALRVPFAEIHPATWKAAFSLFRQPKDKSIAVAKQLYPASVDWLKRKKDHGRAEALLIAEYARRGNM
jgi:hypothetical protein